MKWEFDFLYALQNLHNPILNPVMVFLSLIGEAGIIWILAAIVFLCVRKYRSIGIQMVISMVATLIIGNLILKNLIARDRPCWIDTEVALLVSNPKDYSFPSGHSMNGFTAAVTIFMNDRRLGSAALVLALLIAFSRLYNFVHFPTVIIGGICIGTAVAIIVCMVWHRTEAIHSRWKFLGE